MGSVSTIVLCLAYVAGLLSTVVAWGGGVVLALGVGLALTIRRVWRFAPNPQLWLAAGVVGLLASLYFQARVPYAGATDVSKLLSSPDAAKQEWIVSGEVDSLPRLTRSQNAQVWLTVQQVLPNRNSKPVSGKVYVTVPRSEAAKLLPGQTVRVAGSLYLPKPATNPGGFDFQAYLRQEGCFTGMRGRAVEVPEQPARWGWWTVQQQIVRSQARWLSGAEGPLVSAMVLGGRAVDMPYEVKDAFVRAGLAHALAASGFQTSLILGMVLALTYRWSERVQFCLGTGALALFVGLAGAQPAVLRAALMGFGGLVALVLGRKVKPLGSLLVAIVILLVVNPLWIWNLGFQLSVLATLGLLVTVPPIAQRLDWLPSALSPLIAVPIAAYLWTLPVQLYAFGVVSPYSILVNVIATPLISLLSIGGMISALAALVWSPAGSALAWLLKLPAQALLAIVNGSGQLPGNAYAVGTISVLVAVVLYALLTLTWLQRWWQQRWWVALLLGVGLVFFPAWQARAALFRVTVLAAKDQPILVIQDGQRLGLVNSGDDSTTGATVLPFLQKEGVNQIDWAIATASNSATRDGWIKLREQLPIKTAYAVFPDSFASADRARKIDRFVTLTPAQTASLGASQLKLVNADPPIVELQLQTQRWLWLGSLTPQQQTALVNSGKLPATQVLWWSGRQLQPDLITALRPQVAIASGNAVHPDTADRLRAAGTRVYSTGRDGAVQWTAREGVKTLLDSDNKPTAL